MKKFYSLVISLVLLASLGMAQKAPTGDIWLHMLTTGQPAATRFLGDQLNSSGSWYVNFEVGQTVWHQTDAGIGQSNTDPSAWTWTTAIQYEIGSGNNRRVRSDLGNFRFTQTGTWYFAGRAKGDAGDPFHYANTDVWGHSETFAPIYYFTVNALNNPSSQTAARNTTNPTTAIDLSWTKDGQSHNVMIVRKKVGDSWTDPTQGTAYIVGNSLGSGVVVYNGSGTSFTDSGLNPATGYEYKFYSENFSYYSVGVTTAAVYTASNPAAFNVTGTGSYCPSGSGLAVGLDGSESGVTYTLIKDGTATETTVAGDGSATSFGTQLAGTYTVSGAANGGNPAISGTTPMNENAEISVVTAPTAFVSSTSPLIIIGEPYPLNEASATKYTSLTWATDGEGTFSDIHILNPTYTGTSSPGPFTTLTLTATNSCFSTSASAQFVLSPGSDNLVWTGFTSSDWFTGSNWNPGVIPGSVTNVNIPSGLTRYPIVGSAASCKNLTLESGASILDNGNLNVTGTANVEVTITAGKYHSFSPSVAGAVAGLFSAPGTTVYLFGHDETQNAALNGNNEPTGGYTGISSVSASLSPMTGYAVYSTAAHTFTQTGDDINTGTFTKSLTRTGSGNYAGYNYVGNPYPSYIDWAASTGWTKTGISNTTYIENNGNWAVYPYSGGTGLNEGSRYIAPGQGFFVLATSSSASLSMTNAVRTNTTTAYLKSSPTNIVRLVASGNNRTDETAIRFDSEATAQFDAATDAPKLAANDTEYPQIYSVADKNLAFNTLPETDMVQLGFKAEISGSYSIGMNYIADLQYVTLEDTKTGIFTELSKGAYTFDYSTGENELRFKLHFSALSVDETKTKAAHIYSYQKTVYVNVAEQTEGDIYIYNIAGQLVASKPSARGMNEIGVQVTGNYIVKVITKGSTVVEKVFVQ